MKNTNLMVIATLILLGVSGAAAQSLGDYAKAARKNKGEPASTAHHFDNDNLPTSEGLSVVGPPPPSDAKAGSEKKVTAAAPSTTNADSQKKADEWKAKLDEQKAKIDALNHELDLDQREVRLRAAALYSDPAVRGRNAAQWDKDDLQYKNDMDEKQKAIDAARQQFEEMQEQARKAGIKESDKDQDRK